jgi:hypothetical protein
MIVYKVHPAYNKHRDSKYAPLYACDVEQALYLDRWRFLGPDFHGPFTRENWTKPYGNVWHVKGLPLRYEGKKRRADCDYTSGFLVCSQHAIDLLGDYLDVKHGEFLPVLCDERSDLQIFRCMNCLDALDREKSQPYQSDNIDFPGWDTVDETGILKKVQIDKLAFIDTVIDGNTMFLLPCHWDIGTFVTDQFVRRFQETKLRGLGFRPVWSSERGPLCENPFYYRQIDDDFPDLNF